ncbi:MAG: hypothetical protein J6T10_15585 [Methanobrevibacter sp.]|nr:hypothetical protein [Methanobrevibacter sp.]
MTNDEIIAKVKEAVKGRYINFTKEKDLGEGYRKVTDMVIRLGVDYSHMSINANKETGPLPYGHYLPGLENLVIEHTKVDKKTGEYLGTSYYLRISSCTPEHPDSGADVVATRYYDAQGREVSKEEVLAVVGEKKMESHASAVYNVKFENIIKIGK